MNFKNIAIRELQEFIEKRPDMSLGEIFYSIVRENNSGVKLSELKDLTDEKVYSIIEKARQFEND